MELARNRFNLRALIVFLCIASVTVTILNTFQSVYQVQRDLIIRDTLESNRIYAQKMAEMTDTFLSSSMSQLKFSANYLTHVANDALLVDREIERVFQQSDSFNSTYFVSRNGQIRSISSNQLSIKLKTVSSEGALQPIAAKAPLISSPMLSPAGNYMINITYPLFSTQNDYLGYVGGSIYLNKTSFLSYLFGNHSYQDGSYIYVVDDSKTLIYHPQPERVGEVVESNVAINALTAGQSGSLDIVNSKGVAMLAGFYPVKHANWGVVAQSPKEQALLELESQMWQVLLKSAPIGLITIVVIWLAAAYISMPLSQLAKAVKNYDSTNELDNELQHIRPWYFEANQLKLRLSDTFSEVTTTVKKLSSESLTDPMTGLLNRRGLAQAIDRYFFQDIPSSILALDLDRFKQVNDKYGHTAGDLMLQQVAILMQKEIRSADMICRSGGEEFVIFLAGADIYRAKEIAERIRTSIESYSFKQVGHATISIGISHWGGQAQSIGSVIKQADDALYVAKRSGRNRVEIV